jgi:hypothetical protein
MLVGEGCSGFLLIIRPSDFDKAKPAQSGIERADRPFQYIREMARGMIRKQPAPHLMRGEAVFRRDKRESVSAEIMPKKVYAGLRQREIFRAGLAAHLVGLELEVDLLAFRETGKTGPLDRADVHEHIAAAVVGLDEAKTLLAVKPLDSTCRHFRLQRTSRDDHAILNSTRRCLWEGPAGAFKKAQRLIE